MAKASTIKIITTKQRTITEEEIRAKFKVPSDAKIRVDYVPNPGVIDPSERLILVAIWTVEK